MNATNKANVLIVDDRPEKLLIFSTVLEELEQNIITASSGSEALKRVLEYDFAVILLDVNMPDLDGLETASLIRQRKRSAHTPIIFITAAHADEVHETMGYSLGAVDYILSPVVPEILKTKVKVFVDLYLLAQREKQQAEERVNFAKEHAARAAAEEATRRSTFLAEASRALANSLDFETTAKEITCFSVPFLADLSALTLTGEGGKIGETKLTWKSSQKIVHCESRAERLPISPPSPSGRGVGGEGNKGGATDPISPRVRSIASLSVSLFTQTIERVLRSGRSEVLRDIDQIDIACLFASATEKGEEIALALKTMIVLPVIARGHKLGVLSLGLEQPDFDTNRLALAEDLVSRAAIALDNARLYQKIQEGDRRKNEFLAMLAHELRNPLVPIRNAAYVLRMDKNIDIGKLNWATDIIERQLQQLVRLVDDLLDVSRITRGKIQLEMKPVDVCLVVAAAVETSRPLIESRKHQLIISLPPKSVFVHADFARLAQVLANLLNNAAKYTEVGGHIAVNVTCEDKEVVFCVSDSGMGIPKELLSNIFELFTQADRTLDRSQGGLGIGLTLVQRLVEMQGGSVAAYSAGLNKGSEFIVRLPLILKEIPINTNNHPIRLFDTKNVGLSVLLVEDNSDVAESTRLLLDLAGYKVKLAHDSFTALEALKSYHPEIILIDIGLPGMNGYELAQRLRAQGNKILLIAISGYGQEKDRQRASSAGFDHHLVKPLDPASLPGLLASLYKKQQPLLALNQHSVINSVR